MPASPPRTTGPIVLICGDDEFAVKQRARAIYQEWTSDTGGMDHEIIDAAAANSGEALRSVARLREALDTLPFFGGTKVVWWQNCSFLGDDRTAGSAAVTEALAGLAESLKSIPWDNLRLLISAAKVDKRKTFYKTIGKLGQVESFIAWSVDDKNWEVEAEQAALLLIKQNRKRISDEAVAALVQAVGPNARQLQSEVEKLVLFVGEHEEISASDVSEIVTHNKQARAFALADALGDRDLPRLLRTLDQELWSIEQDKRRGEIGLLYGLISKVRVMIFLREMLAAGWIKPTEHYARFKSQLEQVPGDQLPKDKKFNPLAINPYMLFKALPHARNYTGAELALAMSILLDCNRRLVTTGTEKSVVIQQALTRIVRRPNARPHGASRGWAPAH